MKVKNSDVKVVIELVKSNGERIMLERDRKTGYERVEDGAWYYLEDENGIVCKTIEEEYAKEYDKEVLWQIQHTMRYDNGNYYSDEAVARNNARADKLMRCLRRFAVKNRIYEKPFPVKWIILYSPYGGLIAAYEDYPTLQFGNIIFDTKEAAEAAIEEFRDELIWYFTEYKDSL